MGSGSITPVFLLWVFGRPKDADFVCIEPWCGIADSVASTQQLAEKEGMNKLVGGENVYQNVDGYWYTKCDNESTV